MGAADDIHDECRRVGQLIRRRSVECFKGRENNYNPRTTSTEQFARAAIAAEMLPKITRSKPLLKPVPR